MSLIRLYSELPQNYHPDHTPDDVETDTETDTESETEAESESEAGSEAGSEADSVPAEPHGLDDTCPECHNLDPLDVILSEPGDWAETYTDEVISYFKIWGDFLGAVKNGQCNICPILVEVLSFYGLDRDPEDEYDLHTPVEVRMPNTVQGNIELAFDGVSGDNIVVQVYVARGDPWRGVQPLPEKLAHTFSAQALLFMRASIQNCAENHERCRRPKVPGRPARILDVGATDDASIRLIDFTRPACERYVALSYCWGDSGDTTLRLLSHNEAAHREGIQVRDLPSTLADAVELSRRLGFRYLWVDALCIVQDRHQDWVVESAKLAGVYSNAFLTVVAAAAGGVAEPFLRRPPPPGEPVSSSGEPVTVDPYTRMWSRELPNGTLLKARVIPQVGIHARWRRDEANQPDRWSRRGWTLQEQLLSTRMLCFFPSEMQWNCLEAVSCECHSKLNLRKLFGEKQLDKCGSPHDAHYYWQKVVENYSSRALTQPLDRLAAISGIAARVQKKTKSRYVAGMWMGNIEMDLLWRRATACPAVEEPGPAFVAPTFSWASIGSEVDYCLYRDGTFGGTTAVVSIDTPATSSDAPLGLVSSGEMTLHGPFSEGVIEGTFHDDVVLTLAGFKVHIVLDTRIEHVVMNSPKHGRQSVVRRDSFQGLTAEEAAAKRARVDPARPPPTPRSRCWAMRMTTYPGLRATEWLILGCSHMKPEGHERIGVATIRMRKSRHWSRLEQIKAQETMVTITVV